MFDIGPLKPPSDQVQAEAGYSHPERKLGTIEIVAWLVVRMPGHSLESGKQIRQTVSPLTFRMHFQGRRHQLTYAQDDSIEEATLGTLRGALNALRLGGPVALTKPSHAAVKDDIASQTQPPQSSHDVHGTSDAHPVSTHSRSRGLYSMSVTRDAWTSGILRGSEEDEASLRQEQLRGKNL